MKTFKSDISQEAFPINECVLADNIQRSLFKYIQQCHPEFTEDSKLALTELNTFREKYIGDFLEKEVNKLSHLKSRVTNTLKQHSDNELEEEEDTPTTFGQRLSDRVADFGGSWKFLISFGLFILLWMGINAILLSNNGFDPFPFILLNLLLSCLAAIQAPIIMMSQNRQEEKDRERARKDYMIDMKGELEVRLLHEKVDHLIHHQQHRLIEIQKMQVEMINEVLSRIQPPKK